METATNNPAPAEEPALSSEEKLMLVMSDIAASNINIAEALGRLATAPDPSAHPIDYSAMAQAVAAAIFPLVARIESALAGRPVSGPPPTPVVTSGKPDTARDPLDPGPLRALPPSTKPGNWKWAEGTHAYPDEGNHAPAGTTSPRPSPTMAAAAPPETGVIGNSDPGISGKSIAGQVSTGIAKAIAPLIAVIEAQSSGTPARVAPETRARVRETQGSPAPQNASRGAMGAVFSLLPPNLLSAVAQGLKPASNREQRRSSETKATESTKPPVAPTGIRGAPNFAGRATGGIIGGARAAAGAAGGVASAVGGAALGPITAITSIVESIGSMVGKVNPAIMEAFGRVMDDTMATIGTAVIPIMQVMVEHTRRMGDVFATLLPVIAPFVDQLAKLMTTVSIAGVDVIKAMAPVLGILIAFVPVLDVIAKVVSYAARVLVVFLQPVRVLGALFQLIGAAIEALVGIIGPVEGMESLFQRVADAITAMVEWCLRQIDRLMKLFGKKQVAEDKEASSQGRASKDVDRTDLKSWNLSLTQSALKTGSQLKPGERATVDAVKEVGEAVAAGSQQVANAVAANAYQRPQGFQDTKSAADGKGKPDTNKGANKLAASL